MSDIVDTLSDYIRAGFDPHNQMKEARSEIERLNAENERLREALRKLITHALDCEKRLDEFHGLGDDAGSGMSSVVCGARAALAEKGEK